MWKNINKVEKDTQTKLTLKLFIIKNRFGFIDLINSIEYFVFVCLYFIFVNTVNC